MRIPTLLSFAILLSASLVHDAIGQDQSSRDETRGAKKIGGAAGVSPAQGYGRKWALIIGVNYVDQDENEKRSSADRLLLPVLKNAENDSASVIEVLTTHYGYEKPAPDRSFKTSGTVLLQGSAATERAIITALNQLADKDIVKSDDSVLVFFAGHGGRLDATANDRGAIYPYDIVFYNGRPSSNYIGLHSKLVNIIGTSSARHSLIVLDSCHSGEIFNLQARPRSETDDRGSPQLFGERAIQAIASCRAPQVAYDGPASNSPFTSGLLQALRQLPSHDLGEKKTPVWANRLFRYMRAELSSLPNGQSPDCRCLSNDDGEFYFFPSGDFSKYAGNSTDFRLLQAMVPGEHGNWWFDETPWFMPSLRRMILEKLEEERGSAQATAISSDRLRSLAELAISKMQKQLQEESDDIVKMRLRHLEQLLRGENRSEFQKQVEQLVNDLDARREDLDATDAHYLAVAKHRLRRSDTADAYREAIELYERADDEGKSRHHRPLLALCYSDRGHYLLEVKGDPMAATQDFEKARTLFDSRAPVAFRVYVLCREADCWQRQNRWGEANRKLLEALDVSSNFDAQHGLTSFVHRRRAWSFMEQWRIAEAETSFQKANEILENLVRASDAGSKGVEVAALNEGRTNESFEEDVLVRSDDFDGMIAYLHNLHGLAMARRFQGDGGEAVAQYRALVGKITHAVARLRQGSRAARIGTGVEPRLLERVVNSQERLADCNLFGNPEQVDLKEAIDDYRRSLSMCHLLPNGNQIRLSLLLKKAMALSVPSPYQDTELAQAYCREAVLLKKDCETSLTGVERTLIELAPPLVDLFSGLKAQEMHEDDGTGLEPLRSAIVSARNRIGQNIHRDQLELLLFVSRHLVERIPQADRYHLAEDAEMLLGLCRLALPRHISSSSGSSEFRQDTREYLRPFYDAVLRTKLRLRSSQVSDLLEIQWEATRGELYVKQEKPMPVLAIYVLDDKCYLFVDVPRGVSKMTCFEEDVDLRTLRGACWSDTKLTLPREITRELDRLCPRSDSKETPSDNAALVGIECWWEDPVRAIGVPRSTLGGRKYSNTVVLERADGSGKVTVKESSQLIAAGDGAASDPSTFPFQIPRSLRSVARRLNPSRNNVTVLEKRPAPDVNPESTIKTDVGPNN